jgi:hypothetical protein
MSRKILKYKALSLQFFVLRPICKKLVCVLVAWPENHHFVVARAPRSPKTETRMSLVIPRPNHTMGTPAVPILSGYAAIDKNFRRPNRESHEAQRLPGFDHRSIPESKTPLRSHGLFPLPLFGALNSCAPSRGEGTRNSSIYVWTE